MRAIYNGVVIHRRENLASILEDLTYDDDWWQFTDFDRQKPLLKGQAKVEIAAWLVENFGDLSEETKERLLLRLVENPVLAMSSYIARIFYNKYYEISPRSRYAILSALLTSKKLYVSSSMIEKFLEDEHLPRILRKRMGEIAKEIEERTLNRDFPVRAIRIEAQSTVAPLLKNMRLRDWWHEILRNYNKYYAYAIILALPGDTEVVRYQIEFGDELEILSGDICLVMTLSSLGFKRYGYDLSHDNFSFAIKESTFQGYSTKIAEIFDIRFSEFPSLLVFSDIRKPEHALISLAGLSAEDISRELRMVFSFIREAAKQEENPVTFLERMTKKHFVYEKAAPALSATIRSVAGKTLEVAIESLIRAKMG